MTLREFEENLAELIGRPTDLFPFVCKGSPLRCDVFLVGFNPATEMVGDFWDHEKIGVSFGEAAWFQAQLADRRSRPLRPGKNSRPAVSDTRLCLGWIKEGADGAPILETFARATATKAELALKARSSEPFSFLVETHQAQDDYGPWRRHTCRGRPVEYERADKDSASLARWSEDRAGKFGRSLATGKIQ